MATDSRGAAAGAARRAAHSATLRQLARLGLLGYALLHLVVAWLALQLAWGQPADGSTDGRADQAGAMAVLARSPMGGVLLWVLASAEDATGTTARDACVLNAVEDARAFARVMGDDSFVPMSFAVRSCAEQHGG